MQTKPRILRISREYSWPTEAKKYFIVAQEKSQDTALFY